MGLGWPSAGVPDRAAASWDLGLAGGTPAEGAWRLDLSGVAPGAVPVGRRAPSAWAGTYVGAGWEREGLAASLQVSAARPYGGFAGPLRLVDGTVYGEASRVWSLEAKAGEGLQARVLYGSGLPLWYARNRMLSGQAWAAQLQVGASQLQAVASDTGWHRLTFETLPDVDARRMEAAVLGGFRIETAADRLEWTARFGLSQRAEREGDDLDVENGWAALVQWRNRRLRPGWRLAASAVSPGFASPLWGDEAPVRDRLTLEGRWSWARGKGPAGGWVEAEAARRLAGPWVRGRALAGLERAFGGGSVTLAAGATFSETKSRLSPAAQVAYERGKAGISWELGEGAASRWKGWARLGQWDLAASVWPAQGTVRLEGRWAPQEGSGRWPPQGLRLVAKWQAGTGRRHFFAEAGWAAGGGGAAEALTMGLRVGRWDQGHPERFDEGPLAVLFMMGWALA